MPCWEARETVWPVSEPPPPDSEDEAWTHVRACPSCRRWLRRDAEVSLATSRADPSAPAPASLRRRIERAIAEEAGAGREPASLERPPGRAVRPRRGGWIGEAELPASRPTIGVGAGRSSAAPPLLAGGRLAGALAALLVLAAVAFQARTAAAAGAGDFSDALARDFVRHTREEVRLSVADPEAISRFFAEHVGRALEPLRVPGAEIQGAMICWLEDRPTAMVMYRFAGHDVAHYRARVEGGSAPAEVRTLERDGVRLAEWRRNGRLHALVSDLEREELLRLARGRFGVGGG